MSTLLFAVVLSQPPAVVAPSAALVEEGLGHEVRRATRLVCRRRYTKLEEVQREVLAAALVDAEDKTILNAEARRYGTLELAAAYYFMRGDLLKVEVSVVDTAEQPGGGTPITREQLLRVVEAETQLDASVLRRCQVNLSGDPVEGFDVVVARRERASKRRPGRGSERRGRR